MRQYTPGEGLQKLTQLFAPAINLIAGSGCALAFSEVLFLCEQHSVDVVVIAAEVKNGELVEKQLPGVVMRLKAETNAAYVDWELSQLFPNRNITIQ